jgi:hypothetical protein
MQHIFHFSIYDAWHTEK